MTDGQCEYHGTRYAPEEPQKTLRDEFAMAALTGLCAYQGRVNESNGPEHFAKWSYALADAMLAVRNG